MVHRSPTTIQMFHLWFTWFSVNQYQKLLNIMSKRNSNKNNVTINNTPLMVNDTVAYFHNMHDDDFSLSVIRNDIKVDRGVDVNGLHGAIIECISNTTVLPTKHRIVDIFNTYGVRTVTKPTDTIALNDLYFQFANYNRVHFSKNGKSFGFRSVDRETCETVATMCGINTAFVSLAVDGQRKYKVYGIPNTVENFTTVFNWLLTDTTNLLPTDNQ